MNKMTKNNNTKWFIRIIPKITPVKILPYGILDMIVNNTVKVTYKKQYLSAKSRELHI